MRRIGAGERVDIDLSVNGVERHGSAEARTSLADFLRHELALYGTHVGCEHGVCGACTVILDGTAVRSCMTLAVQAAGAEVTTVEGLAAAGAYNALQRAFSKNGALQCGFCTAGILLSATLFLRENPAPTEAMVRDMLSGHICRCTGYHGIVAAIIEAAAMESTGE